MLVGRSALQIGHYGTVLVAIGFVTMAGLFAVHALSTPNCGLAIPLPRS